ncbi:MAG: hypothetical protein BGP25_04980 [Lysobacterales bacterium 63-13]|nr:MAG: hypothetical protein BGP25_04980 [Xanthomonadales bacterium 63-13]
MTNSILLTNGATLAATIDGMGEGVTGQVVLVLTRGEIEKGLVGDAVDRLMVLSDSAQYTRRFGNRLLVMVEGYGSDPRELHQIDECRRFFRDLNAQWPYWFHFAERDFPGASTLGVVLMQLLDTQVEGRERGIVTVSIAPGGFGKLLTQQFDGLNALYALHGFSMEENTDTTLAVNAALERLFAAPGALE